MYGVRRKTGPHLSILKGKRASFANNSLFCWIVWWTWWKWCFLRCVIRFPISFRWYAFPNFWTPISHPLAYGVRTSSKASATAAYLFFSLCLWESNRGQSIDWQRDDQDDNLHERYPVREERPEEKDSHSSLWCAYTQVNTIKARSYKIDTLRKLI